MGALGLLLAAGRGRRLGGPKALLAWPFPPAAAERPWPLAEVHARAMLEAGCERVLVVTRADLAARLDPLLGDGSRTLVSQAADPLGPAGSIAAAAEQLQGEGALQGVALVAPVDLRPVSAATMRCLLGRLATISEGTPPLAVRPCHQGRRGHPIALQRSLLQPFLSSDPPILRDVLREAGSAVVDLDVDDAAVLEDIDTVADWRRTVALFSQEPVALRFL